MPLRRKLLVSTGRIRLPSSVPAALLRTATCGHFHFWLLAAVSSQRVCVGFSHCCLHVRLETGFTAFSIQRASAGASCYRVTKQTRHCSAQPGTNPITWPVVHLLHESGAILIVTSRLPVCFKASLMKDELEMRLGEPIVRSRFYSGSSF